MYKCQLHINGQILIGWDVGEENGMIVFFEEISWKKYLVDESMLDYKLEGE